MSDEEAPKPEAKPVEVTVMPSEASIVPVSQEAGALANPNDIVSLARAATVGHKLAAHPTRNQDTLRTKGVWADDGIELGEVITSVDVKPHCIIFRYDQGEYVLVQQELAKIDGLQKDQTYSRIGLNNMLMHAEWNMDFVSLTILMDRGGNTKAEYSLELANSLAKGLEHIMTRSAMEQFRTQATILSNQAIGEKPKGPLSLE